MSDPHYQADPYPFVILGLLIVLSLILAVS
jgi:hypothetical protein